MSDQQVTLTLVPCFHREVLDHVPNPRKKWVDPRTCPVCRKRRRIGEVEVHYLSS